MFQKHPKFLSLCIFMGGWYILGLLLSPVLLPRPHTVLPTFFNSLVHGTLLADLGMTLARLMIGFAIGATIGVFFGLIIGSFDPIYKVTEFMIDFFRSVPGTALFPLFMLLFGLGNMSKCAMAAYSATLITTFNTAYGVRNSNKMRRLIARTMRARPVHIFLKVTLPEAMPQIAVGLRLSVSSALIYIVATEMFMGTTTGIGYRIYNANVLFRTREMYASILAAGLLGYLLNQTLARVETRILHWAGK